MLCLPLLGCRLTVSAFCSQDVLILGIQDSLLDSDSISQQSASISNAFHSLRVPATTFRPASPSSSPRATTPTWQKQNRHLLDRTTFEIVCPRCSRCSAGAHSLQWISTHFTSTCVINRDQWTTWTSGALPKSYATCLLCEPTTNGCPGSTLLSTCPSAGIMFESSVDRS